MKDQEENMCFESGSMGGRVIAVNWQEGTGFQLAGSLIHLDERLIHLKK